jgi:hypothetical protein
MRHSQYSKDPLKPAWHFQQRGLIENPTGARVPVGAPLLEPLVHRCGGVLVLHEGFGAAFAYDLQVRLGYSGRVRNTGSLYKRD